MSEPLPTPMEVRLEEVDWYVLVHRMRNRLQDRYKVDWLADWVNPAFTTTLDADFMTASIIMLGTTKSNFEAPANISCGLPSVTLLGTKEDWEAMVARVEKLPLFGPEPASYRDRLVPVLRQFVASFDSPDGHGVKDFWNQIVSSHRLGLAGLRRHKITGWLTSFFLLG